MVSCCSEHSNLSGRSAAIIVSFRNRPGPEGAHRRRTAIEGRVRTRARSAGSNSHPRPATDTMTLERDWILRRAVELGASDLILTAGHPALVTIAGRLQPLPESDLLTAHDTRRLGESLLTSAQCERFERDLELDARFHLPGVAHFRINLYVQRGQWGAA